jgi:ribosomal protein S18 acetylase RimI-like enzyme
MSHSLDAIVLREGLVEVDSLSHLRARCDFGVQPATVLSSQMSGARWVMSAWDSDSDSDRLVGFARAISDGVTNAYVSSVMVDPDYRRRGIARMLLDGMMKDRQHIRWVLHTRLDAIPFYEAIGFSAAPDMMWRDRARL